jgi:predicted membrane protein
MKKVFWGLFFIVAAVFVIINQLGYYTDVNLFTLLCTILIIPILLKSLYKINFTGIFFSIAFLCILYREPLNLESITPIPVLLAALFFSIGFSIMFDKHRLFRRYNCNFDQVINEADLDSVDLNVNFGSSIKYVNSEDFKSANLRCSFGAMEVYFDNAKIIGDSAIINLDVSFGGVELYIPKEWKIIENVDVTLGGIEQKRTKKQDYEKTVTLTGRVNLAGVEIHYI